VNKIPLLGRLRSLFDTLRGNYWFVPMVMAFGAGAAAFGLVEVDRRFLTEPIPWISSTDADGTRAVLSVIAGSMITVTGVVFSITVVALTLASSQFGPRLLRNFLRDRANQLAFGTFVATFLYSLLVLRAVRADEIPHLAATVAVVLAAASLFVLIYFIHHTATSIQASSVIAAVANEIEPHLRSLFPEQMGSEEIERASLSIESSRRQLEADGVEVRASREGFVRIVDEETILRLAVAQDAVILLHRRPGDFIAAGSILARVAPGDTVEKLGSALQESFIVGDHRTPVQDLEFLIGQLTEIALRALSPGINDPRTAIDCVHRLGAVVSSVIEREMPSGIRHDEDGRLCVLAPPTTFEQIVASCFDPVRRYGAGHVAVVVATLDALRDAGERSTDPGRRSILASQAVEIHAASVAEDPSARDLAIIQEAFDRAMKQIEDAS